MFKHYGYVALVKRHPLLPGNRPRTETSREVNYPCM